jgi:hypothetical protein
MQHGIARSFKLSSPRLLAVLEWMVSARALRLPGPSGRSFKRPALFFYPINEDILMEEW